MQVDEAFREYLKGQPFVVLCLEMDLGSGSEAVLLAKGSRDLLSGLREAGAPLRMGWSVQDTPSGPVVCLVLACSADGVGELAGETYFDIAADDDRSVLQSLATQEHLSVAFLDEDLQVTWFRKLLWDELRRLEAEQTLDRAEELLERAQRHDFEAAREIFQQKVTLDELVATRVKEVGQEMMASG